MFILFYYHEQLFKQGHPVFFHLSGVKEFLVMLEPVAVFETFFGVMAGRIAVIGFLEELHLFISFNPEVLQRHNTC